MDTNAIKQAIREDFDIAGIEKRQAKRMAQQPEQVPTPQVPVDYLRQQQNRAYKYNKKPRLNGSTQKVFVDAHAVAELLKPQYQKAKDDSERLLKIGDKEGARIAKEQYMRDVFLPTVEALVGENSPEEVINATKALEELDKYTFTEAGSGNGYTGSFVMNLYQSDMGNVLPTSDTDVQRIIVSLVRLINGDQIRAAVGLANRIKKQIDSGEHTASEEDYELIQKISLRGQ